MLVRVHHLLRLPLHWRTSLRVTPRVCFLCLGLLKRPLLDGNRGYSTAGFRAFPRSFGLCMYNNDTTSALQLFATPPCRRCKRAASFGIASPPFLCCFCYVGFCVNPRQRLVSLRSLYPRACCFLLFSTHFTWRRRVISVGLDRPPSEWSF